MFDDDDLWGAAFAPQAADFHKYRPDQPRDAHGRFAAESGGALASAANELESTVTPHDADSEAQGSLRAFARRAITALHERATALARAAGQTLRSTRLVGVHPITGGGIEVQTTHDLPSGDAHMRSFVQVHPYQVRHPTAQKLLSAAHHTLLVAGRRYVSPKHPPIGVTFKNGTA